MSANSKIEWTDATWHEKAAAARIGVSPEEYIAHLALNQKWCTRCKCWHHRSFFGIDRSRSDGLKASCRGNSRRTLTPEERRAKQNARYRKYYAGNGGASIRAEKIARKRKTFPISPEIRDLLPH